METIARGHEASVRIAMQGHHAAAAAARLPVATLSQMLKSALSVELDTRQVSQRLMRLIKADRWHLKAEQILRSHAKPTGAICTLELNLLLLMQTQRCMRLYHNKTLHVDWLSRCGMWPRFILHRSGRHDCICQHCKSTLIAKAWLGADMTSVYLDVTCSSSQSVSGMLSALQITRACTHLTQLLSYPVQP